MNKFAWQKRLHGVKMNPSTYRVLITIADYANADGSNAFPGEELIAKDCGVSPRTVQRNIADLKEAGWLVEESRGRKSYNGVGRKSSFRLSAPDGAVVDEVSEETQEEFAVPAPGHVCSTPGCSSKTFEGDALCPDHQIEADSRLLSAQRAKEPAFSGITSAGFGGYNYDDEPPF